MVRIDGSNIVVDGQATLNSAPNSAISAVPSRYVGTLKSHISLLNLAAGAPIDLPTLTVISAKYVPVRCFVYNPTADLSAATLGLYTAAAAGGTEIAAPTLLASLTGVGKFQELTISALTDAITSTVLYPRLTVDSANAGTASLVLEFIELGLI